MIRSSRLWIALVAVVLGSDAAAQENQYGWTISNNVTDPFANTGAPFPGLNTLYLWYACNSNDGLTAAEFALEPPPLAVTPAPGWIVPDPPPPAGNVQLITFGCPAAPIVAASVLYIDVGAGLNICIVPSINGLNVSFDCSMQPWENDYIGYASDGTDPCQTSNFCDAGPISVEGNSWGGVKALYR